MPRRTISNRQKQTLLYSLFGVRRYQVQILLVCTELILLPASITTGNKDVAKACTYIGVVYALACLLDYLEWYNEK